MRVSRPSIAPAVTSPLSTGDEGPTLYLDFLSTATDPRVVFSRASGRTYVDETGTLATVASNVWPLCYDPVTLAPVGRLVEEQRTNWVRNPRAEGYSAGSPGTMPTNWSVGATAGLSAAVVGGGSAAGVPYVDIRLSGTASGTRAYLNFEPSTQITTAQNVSWVCSAYLARVAGTSAGVTAVKLLVTERTAAGASLQDDVGSDTGVSGTLVRYDYVTVLGNASTARAQPGVAVDLTNGAAVDITLRIGAPQFEPGGIVTSVILPTAGSPAVTTRAAEIVYIPTAGWMSGISGTFCAAALVQRQNSTYSVLFSVDDGTSANRIQMYEVLNSAEFRFLSIISGALILDASLGTVQNGVVFKAASSYGSRFDTALNGAAGASGASTFPSGLTTCRLGSTIGGIFFLNGYLRSLRYWPRPLPTGEMRGETQ